MKPETNVWLGLAEDDFQNAKLLWRNHRYGATVFFYQQAVEKILKAYIIESQNIIPQKTHRIELLVKEARLNRDEISPTSVEELSKAYIRVRYPDLSRQYYTKKENVKPLVVIAERVYLWTKKKLKEI